MSDSDYDSDQEEGEEEDYKSSYDRGNGKKVDNKGDIVDEAVKFSSLADDVFGGDISDDDELDQIEKSNEGKYPNINLQGSFNLDTNLRLKMNQLDVTSMPDSEK